MDNYSPQIVNNFTENPLSRYQRLEKIGKGTYGVVYKVKDQETGQIMALKKMILAVESEGIPSTAIREIALLRDVQNENIVGLKDVVFEDNRLYIVFDFIETDLNRYMDSLQDNMPILQVKHFLYQLLKGIASLHLNQIMHRDLKPQNLLITNTGVLKIADFGLGRTFSIPLRPYTHEVVTLWYRAPELLLGATEYSEKIDIWSIGCIFAEMLIKQPLFKGDSEIDQIFRIFRIMGTPNDQIWPGFSSLKEYKSSYPIWSTSSISNVVKLDKLGMDILLRMLTYDPKQRISAKAALKHPYFNDLIENYNAEQNNSAQQQFT